MARAQNRKAGAWAYGAHESVARAGMMRQRCREGRVEEREGGESDDLNSRKSEEVTRSFTGERKVNRARSEREKTNKNCHKFMLNDYCYYYYYYTNNYEYDYFYCFVFIYWPFGEITNI